MLQGLYKSRLAALAFAPYQLAAFGPADNQVMPAIDPTKPLAGVADSLSIDAGSLVDVQMTEIAEVVAGGNIAAGDDLMADANGHVVTAAKQAGATIYTIGRAQVSALAGDVFPVLITLGAIRG